MLELSQSQLVSKNTFLEVWLSPPVPVYTKFYFFNVLNPKEVENGSTPEVQENTAFNQAQKAGNIIVF